MESAYTIRRLHLFVLVENSKSGIVVQKSYHYYHVRKLTTLHLLKQILLLLRENLRDSKRLRIRVLRRAHHQQELVYYKQAGRKNVGNNNNINGPVAHLWVWAAHEPPYVPQLFFKYYTIPTHT